MSIRQITKKKKKNRGTICRLLKGTLTHCRLMNATLTIYDLFDGVLWLIFVRCYDYFVCPLFERIDEFLSSVEYDFDLFCWRLLNGTLIISGMFVGVGVTLSPYMEATMMLVHNLINDIYLTLRVAGTSPAFKIQGHFPGMINKPRFFKHYICLKQS